MDNRRNYYRILHVQPDAPRAIITASYRTLMQKLKRHPDLGGDEWNASLLNEAYAVLSQPAMRAAYDQDFLPDLMAARQETGEAPPDRSKADSRQARGTRTRQASGRICPFCGTANSTESAYGEPRDCVTCTGPLQPAKPLRLQPFSQRAVLRMPHHATVRWFTRIEQLEGFPGIVQDLSPNGLRFRSIYLLQADQLIRITGGLLSATARVTHCRRRQEDGQYLTGAEFLTLRFHEVRGTFVSWSV
jgi:curved DNA-binding protein CbpA